MTRLIAALLLSLAAVVHAEPARRVATNDASFEFSRIQVNAFVNLVLNDATTASYSIDPDVLADTREISVRTKGKSLAELRAMLAAVVEPLGYSVTEDKAGLVHVGKTIEVKKAELEVERELVVYRPRFRSAQYLLDLVGAVITDAKVNSKRAVQNPTGMGAAVDPPPGSALAALDRQTDVLALMLTPKQAGVFQRAMQLLDVPTPEVFVQATLYEVTVSTQDASALSLAAKLFSGKLEVNLAGPALDNSLRINLPGLSIDALLSALQSDARFKVVSNPRLRVLDGSSARLVVGSDVPVLGSVSYTGSSSTPVRSVEYKPSGVILDIKPQIRGEVIDVQLQQQLSSFTRTTTGVNDTPTLIRRDLTSRVSTKPGEVVVLGGLVDSKADSSAAGLPFLPKWTHSKSDSSDRTELMLVMSVTPI